MLDEPSTNKKLRYLGTSLFMGIIYIAVGLVAVLFHTSIVDSLYLTRLASTAFIISGVSMALAGLWFIWHRYSLVTDYFEFSRQTIRDLYLRDLPINELAKLNSMLRRTIESHGIGRARSEAIERLRRGDFHPTVGDYVRENLDRWPWNEGPSH